MSAMASCSDCVGPSSCGCRVVATMTCGCVEHEDDWSACTVCSGSLGVGDWMVDESDSWLNLMWREIAVGMSGCRWSERGRLVVDDG